MNWGLRNRLDRVLPGLPNGTGSVMFAIDHGYFMGPTSGLEDPRKTIVPLLPHADSLMLTRGILQNSIPKRTNIPIVLRVSSGCDVINMSTVPEICLARELELEYQSIAMSTDYDCWHESEEEVTMGIIFETMGKNVGHVKTLIKHSIPLIKKDLG